MGVLCKNPQSSDSGLLVSDTAAASLLSLAAQMALEVTARGGQRNVHIGIFYCLDTINYWQI